MKEFVPIAILVVAAILSPIATIWMLNTLFGLGLAYTVKTWLAALILDVILDGMFTVNVKKN